ncbi:MAG: class II fructose-1,6-bisphosphate aldolase [Alphaproteobacteria bacterium]|nr:class II fructose-1,6-bisphosphate aldolase [Alphaproteobacteria bacterium]
MNYKDFGLVNTRQMLSGALSGGYAVPGYNFNNLEQLQAIIQACIETRSPVILQVSAGARKYVGVEILTRMVQGAIKNFAPPVALHLDHGATFEICRDCIDMGFSSVMIDASDKPFDENVELSQRVAEYAHKHDVSVEAELGALAGIEDDKIGHENHYTNPHDVKRFVELTGVDSLAVSIGTSHGVYKMRNPDGKLRFDILHEIADNLPDFPLVLHGASSVPETIVAEINKYGGEIKDAHGIPADQLIKAHRMNICKINVDSDARLAFTAGVRKILSEQPGAFDPRVYLSAARDMMKEMYIDKNINVMGAADVY